jgi:hypothetical protein
MAIAYRLFLERYAMIDLRFPHRNNVDGTFDSICSRCYMTVASSRIEVCLIAPEAGHVCNPGRMMDVTQDLERFAPSQP